VRRLFWRIFAAFWLANVAIIVTLAWITTSRFESERIPGLEITRLQAAMDDHLKRLARDARRGGAEQLEHSLRVAASMGPLQFYALDADNVDRIGKKPSREVLDAATAFRSGQPALSERMRMTATTLRDDGAEIVLVAAAEGSMFARMIYRRGVGFWSHLGIAMIVSALVSALLAWYVATPLARIRASTRRFAEGDLDARVGTLPFGRSTEIMALAEEFDRMAGRIRDLVENNRRLVRDVSHELRSPLARMRVALELARGKDATPIDKTIDRMELEADRLEAMLAQTIELSRLETRPERSVEVIALDELLEDVLANADYEGTPSGRRIVFEKSMPVRVRGSRAALASAFENIVRNAIAYTSGSDPIEVNMRVAAASDRVVVEIRDHGPGVADSDLERIFEPFYRTDAARARSSGGTGLGLAIALRAIINQGGRIIARNADGGGLAVLVDLEVVVDAH